MTITYALTRIEIVQSFFESLRNSAKFLTMIVIYASVLGVSSLAMRGAFSRSLTLHDLLVSIAVTAGVFVFMPCWLFIRGKTDERTMTVSPEGISTEIGALKGHVPWSKVKLVNDTNGHVLIFGANGNAFFVPTRAFRGLDQQAEFMQQINRWWNTI